MKRLKLLAALALIAAACASEQKVKSARQASQEAKAAAAARANEAPDGGVQSPSPAVEPSKTAQAEPPSAEKTPAEKPAEKTPATPPALPPAPPAQAETPPAEKPAEKTTAAPPALPPAPPAQAETPPAEKPAEKTPAAPPALPPAPPAQAETPPAEKPAETAAKAEPSTEPAAPEEPSSGPRGGLCVARPADAAVTPSRELLPSLEGTGPKVIALEAVESAASVAIQVQFRAGAIDDPPGKAGLTFLAATLMAEGGTLSLDSKALRAALFPFAANIRARVDKELTTFATRMHRDHVDKVAPILSEVILHPRWDEKEFARLRDRAVNDVEKRLRQGDDENLGKEALGELMFAGHPYGRLTLGHVSDLRAITLSELKQHAARVFTADRLTVGLAGGYPEGLGAALVQSLAGLSPKGAPGVAVPAQPARTLHYRLIEKPGASTAVSIGLPYALTRSDPDYIALSIARSAFGEHRQFNGRLMTRLREARGLNYGDYAYIEHFEQQGGEASQAQLGRARHQQELTIWLRPVQNENALFALRAALYELRRTLADEPFSDEEVARTKDFLSGYLLLFDQTQARKLGYALDDQSIGLHRYPGFLDTWRRQLSQVTAAQVNAAWKRWIDPCQLQIVLVTSDAQATKRALLSGEATPIHYQRDGQGRSAEKPAALLQQDKRIERFSFGQPTEAEIDVVPVEKVFE